MKSQRRILKKISHIRNRINRQTIETPYWILNWVVFGHGGMTLTLSRPLISLLLGFGGFGRRRPAMEENRGFLSYIFKHHCFHLFFAGNTLPVLGLNSSFFMMVSFGFGLTSFSSGFGFIFMIVSTSEIFLAAISLCSDLCVWELPGSNVLRCSAFWCV
ncbi:LOW QUALITY PROTEIN: hypothetical protein PanWU01x14_216770 [Parasponia andersonii]|uniref:Transmembrane protein n=1 Tax=Parasponia andersonii TaxID=3476 RepID=A0A2P5BRL2_PARAD|nr:LOW QUALITY PROTEIN: hypothetical protein PanWU01x14_216770 [Parasponia andersonii]